MRSIKETEALLAQPRALLLDEFFEIHDAYKALLSNPIIASCIDPSHLETTPHRVVKSLSELLSGYAADVDAILKTSFKVGKYNQMISVNNIGFCSLCVHHMLPFMGKAHFAYIPDKCIVGLSKIPRLVEAFSRRLQVQEDLSEEIVDTFQRIVKPRGCAIVMEATHLCMSIRGVKKEGAHMRTTALRGIFQSDGSAKSEFLSSLNGRSK